MIFVYSTSKNLPKQAANSCLTPRTHRVGELESTVIFLFASLQSAIGKFSSIESQKNLNIDFGDERKYVDRKKENWISLTEMR